VVNLLWKSIVYTDGPGECRRFGLREDLIVVARFSSHSPGRDCPVASRIGVPSRR